MRSPCLPDLLRPLLASQRDLASKQRCIEELSEEKDDQEAIRRDLQQSFDAQQHSVHARFRDMAEANAALHRELGAASGRLRAKMPFDDGAVPRWSAWNVPPHDHALERAVTEACVRASCALASFAGDYASRLDAQARLLRLQSHHPTLQASDEAHGNRNGDGDGARGGTRALEIALGRTADEMRALCAAAASGAARAGEVLPRLQRLAATHRELAALEARECTPYLRRAGAAPLLPEDAADADEYDEYDGDDGHGDDDIQSGNGNGRRSTGLSRAEKHEEARLLLAEATAIAEVDHALSALVDAVLVAGAGVVGPAAAEETASASGATPDTKQEHAASTPTATVSITLFAAAVQVCGKDVPTGAAAVSACMGTLARRLRSRATLVANRLVREGRRPFLPKAVRVLLETLQGSEFGTATAGERLSEACRRVAAVVASRRRPGGYDGAGAAAPPPSSSSSSSSVPGHRRDHDAARSALEAATRRLRAPLADRGRRFAAWVQSRPLVPTLPHASAVRYRAELEAARGQVRALRGRAERAEATAEQEARHHAAERDGLARRLEPGTGERDAAREARARVQEEGAVAALSRAETERQLRAQLAAAEQKQQQQQQQQGSAARVAGAAAAATDSASAGGDGGAGPVGVMRDGGSSESSNNSSGRARDVTAHKLASGRARYSLHALDYGSVVKGLNTLRLGPEAARREDRMQRHYENQLRVRDMQLGAADAVACRANDKYRAAVAKLQKLVRSAKAHERSVRDSNARVARAKEDLAATREAMAAQSAMLSQQVMDLQERYTAAAETVERLRNNEMRCVHCHGWNRIGRIVGGGPGEPLKPCLHCGRNTGFRSLSAADMGVRLKN